MDDTANLKIIDTGYELLRFLVPVYYRKTVEIMITGVNYIEIGSSIKICWSFASPRERRDHESRNSGLNTLKMTKHDEPVP
jgi:hypothetical protein